MILKGMTGKWSGESPCLLCVGDYLTLTFSSMIYDMYLAWLVARTAILTGKQRIARSCGIKKGCFHFLYVVEGLGTCLPEDLTCASGDACKCAHRPMRRVGICVPEHLYGE